LPETTNHIYAGKSPYSKKGEAPINGLRVSIDKIFVFEVQHNKRKIAPQASNFDKESMWKLLFPALNQVFITRDTTASIQKGKESLNGFKVMQKKLRREIKASEVLHFSL
jgi:hypothetical protein